MIVGSVFEKPIGQSNCVGCGQCAAVCPTGAITVKSDIKKVWQLLDDPKVKVTAQIAPAVRVAVGKEFGLQNENVIGHVIAAMRRLGFDEVFDTATGADLTVLEESNEFINKFEEKTKAGSGAQMPLFTSCCPAWVQYAEKKFPELLSHVSTARSPMQMFAAVIKEEVERTTSRRHVHVAVMPCTAKKFEAARGEFKRKNGEPYVDYVITTQELIKMIQESGIVFGELQPEAVDMPFGTITGAGVIFGVTGGVTEAVLRRISSDKSPGSLQFLSYQGVRGMEGVKTATIKIGEQEAKIAIVSGLKNASDLIENIKSGKSEYRFDFVEVMACPGGCVSGAGQPQASFKTKTERGKGLYAADKLCNVKRSEENPLMMELYRGILKGRVHELLHVQYTKEKTHA
jgi:NADH-quinone oxidoreductase subunit G